MSWAAFANAQVSDADNESESMEPGAPAVAEAEVPTEIPEELFEDHVMDEITVIAGPQGQTPFELELERQALMKEVIFAEMRMREREQEDLAWRQADPDLRNPESRFKWGYSPQAEQRMRRGNEFMYDRPAGQTEPATVFRAEF
jgi:hypothetical protein